MNRILSTASAGILGAAGVLGAAAAFTTISMTTAAPAMAVEGCVPDVVCDVIDEAVALPGSIAAQPGQFAENLAGQPERFTNSIVGAPDRFLNGNCDPYPTGCPEEDAHPGLVNQFDQFATGLAEQPTGSPRILLASPNGSRRALDGTSELWDLRVPMKATRETTDPVAPANKAEGRQT